MSSTVRLPYRSAAVCLLLIVVFFGITFGVLGSAIGWPDVLEQDAAQVLPLITENRTATLLGYYAFIITSILLLPAAVLLQHVIHDRDNPWLQVATGFAVLAVVMRVLGIFRWLFLMPGLATLYLTPDVTGSTQETISLLFQSFNFYTDGFGTHLGDQLFTGLWIGFVGVVLLRGVGFYRWIGLAGIIVMLAQIITCIVDFNLSPNPLLSITQSFVYLWVGVLGLVLLGRRPILPPSASLQA